MLITSDCQSSAYMPVPTLDKNNTEPNRRTLPSGSFTVPKSALERLKSSESEASSILSMFRQELLDPGIFAMKFWSEKKTVTGLLLTMACSVSQLTHVILFGSKLRLIV